MIKEIKIDHNNSITKDRISSLLDYKAGYLRFYMKAFV